MHRRRLCGGKRSSPQLAWQWPRCHGGNVSKSAPTRRLQLGCATSRVVALTPLPARGIRASAQSRAPSRSFSLQDPPGGAEGYHLHTDGDLRHDLGCQNGRDADPLPCGSQCRIVPMCRPCLFADDLAWVDRCLGAQLAARARFRRSHVSSPFRAAVARLSLARASAQRRGEVFASCFSVLWRSTLHNTWCRARPSD